MANRTRRSRLIAAIGSTDSGLRPLMLRLQRAVESSSWWPHAADLMRPTVHPAVFEAILHKEFGVAHDDVAALCDHFSMRSAAAPIAAPAVISMPDGAHAPLEWSQERWNLYPPHETIEAWVLQGVTRERIRHVMRKRKNHLHPSEMGRSVEQGMTIEVEEPYRSGKWLTASVVEVSDPKVQPILYVLQVSKIDWKLFFV